MSWKLGTSKCHSRNRSIDYDFSRVYLEIHVDAEIQTKVDYGKFLFVHVCTTNGYIYTHINWRKKKYEKSEWCLAKS